MLEEREVKAGDEYLQIYESLAHRWDFTLLFVVVIGGGKRNDDESSNARAQAEQTCLEVTAQGSSSLNSVSAQPNLSGTF